MKRIKKFAALLLSAVTIFSTTAPVMAADDTDVSAFTPVVEEMGTENDAVTTVEELKEVIDASKTSTEQVEVYENMTTMSRVLNASPETITTSKTFNASPVVALFQSALAANANLAYYGVVFPSMPVSDDGKVYLYALNPYEYTIPMGATPIASAPANSSIMFSFDLAFGTIYSRLFQKFACGVKIGGKTVMVSAPQYITNPEILAKFSKPYIPIVKGLQRTSMWNVNIEGTGAAYPTYGMKVIKIIASLNRNSATVNPYAQVPDSRPISYNEYALNAFNQAGVNALAVDATALALGSGQAFIIGNEVNERQRYYMSYVGDQTFVREYYQAFRVCYNAIKSINANARVFISITQDWNRNRPQDQVMYVDSKDFCDIFNAYICSEGNIDYGISFHPYTVPLTYAKYWDMRGCANGTYMANQIKSNAMISFQNMSVLTNYLTQPVFYNQYGQPRYFIIDEIGVSATQGPDVQAAALATLWAAYISNPYVHEMIYCDGIDMSTNPSLSGQSLAMWNALGTTNEAAYMQWAMAYLGITSWSQVIR